MHYKIAAEYAGIGAWEVAFDQACKENGDTYELVYYAEWDDKASNAYSAVHNVSEDLNIWDTSLGYREFEVDGKLKYGIYTCMFGKTYIYYNDKVYKTGELAHEDGEVEELFETKRTYDETLVFDDYFTCITTLINIRSQHPRFKVDEDGQFILPKIDILFYSPPCQSYSVAGKREGRTVDKGNMFWNTLVRIRKLQPMYAIMENVKGLPSGNTKKDFYNMLHDLKASNMQNYWKVLNSKDFGIPQNRERVFIHSIRQDLYDQGKRYYFPQPFKLEIALKDILEDEVDDKYYLSQEMVEKFVKNTSERKLGYINQDTQASAVYKTDGVSQTITAGTHGYAMGYITQHPCKLDKCDSEGYKSLKDASIKDIDCEYASTLTARYYKGVAGHGDNMVLESVNQIGNLFETDSFGGNPQRGRIYSGNGICPTLNTMQGGGLEPKVIIAASRGKDKNNPSDRTTGNKNLEQRLEINKDGVSNTITSVQKDNYVIRVNSATKGGVRSGKPRRFYYVRSA